MIHYLDFYSTNYATKVNGSRQNHHCAYKDRSLLNFAIIKNPLLPSINMEILLISPKAFLTVLVGRNCFKTGLSSPLVIIFFILITSVLG